MQLLVLNYINIFVSMLQQLKQLLRKLRGTFGFTGDFTVVKTLSKAVSNYGHII